MAEHHSPVNWQALEVGDRLPALQLPPLTRAQLAIYCGASGDHNPVHVDSDFAREAGLGDVIAHGMLIMAWMGRCLTDQVDQSRIRSFETRFTAMTRVGDAITCEAEVAGKFVEAGEQRLRLNLRACDQRGEIKTQGWAVVDVTPT
ncbi:MAG: dehydratase [Gammaproteobacteria bacterium]|nr:dehydratase [Gammaproteobacteria bacterium]